MGSCISKGRQTSNSIELISQERVGTEVHHGRNSRAGRASEKLVAVIGYTGSGISQFISNVTEGSYANAVGGGTGLLPKTKKIGEVQTTLSDGRRITLIDTPGFTLDPSHVDEYSAFRDLTVWFKENKPNARLDGIVYMQNILMPVQRTKFNMKKADAYLKILCGPDWPNKIVYVCSHFDEDEEAPKKQTEIKEGYWSPMIEKGSHMEQFGPPEDFQRARTILSRII